MASLSFAPKLPHNQRVSLAKIDAVVSARLGPTRGLGKSQPQCFNRQVAMYLASQVGRWSTTVIGRFYGGRDHSTVVHAIQRIETAREIEPDLDVLICDLKSIISDSVDSSPIERIEMPTVIGKPSPRESEMRLLAKEFAVQVRELIREEFRNAHDSGERPDAIE